MPNPTKKCLTKSEISKMGPDYVYLSAGRPTSALNCVGLSISPATDLNGAHLRLNSNSPTYLQMYTSLLPYLPHICEDFLLLENKSMFIFQLLSETALGGLPVISVGVGC